MKIYFVFLTPVLREILQIRVSFKIIGNPLFYFKLHCAPPEVRDPGYRGDPCRTRVNAVRSKCL